MPRFDGACFYLYGVVAVGIVLAIVLIIAVLFWGERREKVQRMMMMLPPENNESKVGPCSAAGARRVFDQCVEGGGDAL